MGIGSIGFTEILVIAVLVLIFFGPQRLPEVTRALGGAMREFRRSLNEIQRELEQVDQARKWESAAAPKPSVDPNAPSQGPAQATVQPDLGPGLGGSATGSPPHATVPVDAATPGPPASLSNEPEETSERARASDEPTPVEPAPAKSAPAESADGSR